MKPWKRIEPTTTHTVGWRTIVTKTFITPLGKLESYDSFGPENQSHVATIGITKDRRVIIATQFRFGPEKIMHELPGGTVNVGEEPAVAAEREFIEETGYKIGKIEYLGPHFKDAYMNATWHYYIAYDCEKVTDQKLDEGEYVSVELISIEQLIDNAINGLVTDAVAILMAYDKLTELK